MAGTTCKFANNAVATLGGAITNVATSMSVTAGQGAAFPTVNYPVDGTYFWCAIEDENNNIEIIKVQVHAAGSDAFTTVVRSQGGTTAPVGGWVAGVMVECRDTAETMQIMAQTDAPNVFSQPQTVGAATASGHAIQKGQADAAYLTKANNLSDVVNAVTTLANLSGCKIGANNSFASGTVMPFFQSAAPIGWTQILTQDDKAMRVVSGVGGGSGGAVAFSTITGQSVAGHQLTTAEMPSHTHSIHTRQGTGGYGFVSEYDAAGAFIDSSQNTNSTGGDGSHSHGVGFQPAYIDLIICSKD
ncbi:MAG: hypothetical protein ACYC9K_00900 [Sulfuricaulis sp.]